MNIILAILGAILIFLGILGCILPILPGPPVSYSGLLVLQATDYAGFSSSFLIWFAVIALVVFLLDYFIPIWGTRKYGGSEYGVWGATLGVVAGLFILPPLGIVIMPIIGAIAGELYRGASREQSIRAGLGSFMGFLLGTGLKLIASVVMGFYYFKELIA